MSCTFTINSDGGSRGLLVSLATACAVKVYWACSSRSKVFVAWMLPVLSSITKMVPAPSPERMYLMLPSPESTSEWSWKRKKEEKGVRVVWTKVTLTLFTLSEAGMTCKHRVPFIRTSRSSWIILNSSYLSLLSLFWTESPPEFHYKVRSSVRDSSILIEEIAWSCRHYLVKSCVTHPAHQNRVRSSVLFNDKELIPDPSTFWPLKHLSLFSHMSSLSVHWQVIYKDTKKKTSVSQVIIHCHWVSGGKDPNAEWWVKCTYVYIRMYVCMYIYMYKHIFIPNVAEPNTEMKLLPVCLWLHRSFVSAKLQSEVSPNKTRRALRSPRPGWLIICLVTSCQIEATVGFTYS